MKVRAVLAAAALTALAAAPASAESAAHQVVPLRHHACTRTSSGTCIRGGEFCPQADYRHSGWDAAGRRYVCKGDRVHPHWEIP